MIYDVNTHLRDHRGRPITEPGDADNPGEPVTLGTIVEGLLINNTKPGADADDKFQQFKLACAVAEATKRSPANVELKAEDVVLIKELAAIALSPVGLGALFTALEGSQVIRPAE